MQIQYLPANVCTWDLITVAQEHFIALSMQKCGEGGILIAVASHFHSEANLRA